MAQRCCGGVLQLRIDAPTGGGNEEEDEYTPASESRIQSRGTASAVDRHARRRASVEAEQAALMVRFPLQRRHVHGCLGMTYILTNT